MERHVAYWSEKAERGIAIVFGPVMDPKGVYGIGVYQVQDEAEMRDLLEHDPAKGLIAVRNPAYGTRCSWDSAWMSRHP